MILAEIHGKRCPELRDREDLLTSAVFGHLRLIPPRVFWTELFARARSVTGETLADALRSRAIDIRSCESLVVDLWPKLGSDEPDVMMTFCYESMPPFAMIVEAKLGARKSGVGENDQLVRYARALERLEGDPKSQQARPYRPVVYLTRRSSLDELRESLGEPSAPASLSEGLFDLQWQDILEVAESMERAEGVDLLKEVADFLRAWGLEHFRGFQADPVSHIPGTFYIPTFFQPAAELLQIVRTSDGHFYNRS